MKRRKYFSPLAVCMILFCLCLVSAPAFAERAESGLGKWLQEVGVFAGYAECSLKFQDDMNVVPTGMRFGFDLKPFTEKFGFSPKGILELVYEPFIGAIISPRSNVEFGLDIFFKYAYPVTSKLYPFVEVGSGPYYMTLSTYEQSTQFNFLSQGGAGLMYFVRKDLAISVEYRRRHVSNATMKSPNAGIDGNEYLFGASLFF